MDEFVPQSASTAELAAKEQYDYWQDHQSWGDNIATSGRNDDWRDKYKNEYERLYNERNAANAAAYEKWLTDTEIQRRFEDMRKAGVNPLSLFMGNAGTVNTAQTASRKPNKSNDDVSKDGKGINGLSKFITTALAVALLMLK